MQLQQSFARVPLQLLACEIIYNFKILPLTNSLKAILEDLEPELSNCLIYQVNLLVKLECCYFHTVPQ